MAQIKTPYGLVYNTDGSLCTTYRDDDIPFPGVRSFAVEEATTNLVPSNIASFTSLSGLYSDSIISREIIEGVGYGGRNAIKIVKNSARTDFQIHSTILRNNILNNIRVGDRISYQIKYKVLDAGEGGYICDFRTWGFGVAYPKTIVDIGNGWFLQYGTSTQQWTESSAITGNCGISELPANSTILFSDFQVEIKNYSTSFVDGSRPNGRIVLKDMQEIEYDNFVFTCWANYRSVAQEWQFVTTIFTPDSALASEANHYSIRYNGNIGYTYLNINSYDLGSTTVGHTKLTEGWHFFLIAVHDGYTDFWIDDAKYTSSKYVVNSKDKNIYLGTWYTGSFPWQNTIANVFVGKYKKPNGEIIWTDEYIREVYEAQIPFAESNKLQIY